MHILTISFIFEDVGIWGILSINLGQESYCSSLGWWLWQQVWDCILIFGSRPYNQWKWMIEAREFYRKFSYQDRCSCCWEKWDFVLLWGVTRIKEMYFWVDYVVNFGLDNFISSIGTIYFVTRLKEKYSFESTMLSILA